jgi:protein-tyrosine phosphatase
MQGGNLKEISDIIEKFDEPSIVHCIKGITRTGIVCATHLMNTRHITRIDALKDYFLHQTRFLNGFSNTSALKKIYNFRKYAKLFQRAETKLALYTKTKI